MSFQESYIWNLWLDCLSTGVVGIFCVLPMLNMRERLGLVTGSLKADSTLLDADSQRHIICHMSMDRQKILFGGMTWLALCILALLSFFPDAWEDLLEAPLPVTRWILIKIISLVWCLWYGSILVYHAWWKTQFQYIKHNWRMCSIYTTKINFHVELSLTGIFLTFWQWTGNRDKKLINSWRAVWKRAT